MGLKKKCYKLLNLSEEQMNVHCGTFPTGLGEIFFFLIIKVGKADAISIL